MRFRTCLVDSDEERSPLFEEETLVTFPSPLAEIDLLFHLGDLVFPVPGEYRLQLHAAGHLLRERRLVIVPLDSAEE